MIKLISLALLCISCLATYTCHYEADIEDNCEADSQKFVYDEYKSMGDYDGVGTQLYPECLMNPDDAYDALYKNGNTQCEADGKFWMKAYENDYKVNGPKYCEYGLNCTQTDAFERPPGTVDDLNNCNFNLDVYKIICVEVVDCVGSWSECSNDYICDELFNIFTPAENGGVECEAGPFETRYCTDDALCPVDCVGVWGACSNDVTCEEEYSVTTPVVSSGTVCDHSHEETRACLDDSLCPVDCEGAWGTCSNDVTCEETYSFTQEPLNSGTVCDHSNGEKRACADTSGCTTTVTVTSRQDCKDIENEADCSANSDSCKVKSRGGKFINCKPKRCKKMTETECEAAVHCEKKFGRTGNYKHCRRND